MMETANTDTAISTTRTIRPRNVGVTRSTVTTGNSTTTNHGNASIRSKKKHKFDTNATSTEEDSEYDDHEEEEDSEDNDERQNRSRRSRRNVRSTSMSPLETWNVNQHPPPQRRSRRETTIHSTKASLQFKKQNNNNNNHRQVQHGSNEAVEGTTTAKNTKHEGEDILPPPKKKMRNHHQKPATTIVSMTIPRRTNKNKSLPKMTSPRTSPTTTMTSPTMIHSGTGSTSTHHSWSRRHPSQPPLEEEAVASSTSLPRRCSVRNRSTTQSLYDLASIICHGNVEEDDDENSQNATTSHPHHPSSRVLFITGAGLSVDSGIRPFRSTSTTLEHTDQYYKHNIQTKKKKNSNHILQAGIWDEVIWTTATRASFRKDPVRWYTHFWNVYFDDAQKYHPNIGHYVMDSLLNEFTNVYQITQNIDGLQSVASASDNLPLPKKQLIEVHGRCGLYKCCPPEEDDNESDDDDGVDASFEYPRSGSDRSTSSIGHHRPVRIGSHKASRRLQRKNTGTNNCPYEYLYSLTSEQVKFRQVSVTPPQQPHQNDKASTCGNKKWNQQNTKHSRIGTDDNRHRTAVTGQNNRRSQKRTSASTMVSTPKYDEPEQSDVTVPTCPHCHNIVMPQALLFDESYHDHTYYQYELVEEWIKNASAIVLVGTSCTVQLTTITLKYAMQHSIPVYNMNIHKIKVPQMSFTSTNTTATTTAVGTESGTTRLTSNHPKTETNISSKSVPTGSIMNILGPASETLPLLLAECRSIQEAKRQQKGGIATTISY